MYELGFPEELDSKEAAIRRLSNGCGTEKDITLIVSEIYGSYSSNVPKSLERQIFLKDNASLFSEIAKKEGTPLTYLENEVLKYYSSLVRVRKCADQISLIEELDGKQYLRVLENTGRVRLGIGIIIDELTNARDLKIKLTGKGGYENSLSILQTEYDSLVQHCGATA